MSKTSIEADGNSTPVSCPLECHSRTFHKSGGPRGIQLPDASKTLYSCFPCVLHVKDRCDDCKVPIGGGNLHRRVEGMWRPTTLAMRQRTWETVEREGCQSGCFINITKLAPLTELSLLAEDHGKQCATTCGVSDLDLSVKPMNSHAAYAFSTTGANGVAI